MKNITMAICIAAAFFWGAFTESKWHPGTCVDTGDSCEYRFDRLCIDQIWDGYCKQTVTARGKTYESNGFGDYPGSAGYGRLVENPHPSLMDQEIKESR